MRLSGDLITDRVQKVQEGSWQVDKALYRI